VSIDPTAAAVAGLVAGQLMEAPTYLQRAAGINLRQDIFAEGGAILRAPARYRRPVGWAGHAGLAVAIVLLYATFFQAVAHNDHLAWWGLLAGAVHGLLGGVVVGAWPDLHPDIPDRVPPPRRVLPPLRPARRRRVRDRAPVVRPGHGALYALLHAGLPPDAAL
jgi:peptidoglycan/LPS O-acetylase OafA/YrhL